MASHKTIAKNTLFLYVRMLITMVISLFTSRVIIDALGFSDYGLYAVVGGITGVIAFMHSSLAGATTRFLNIEIGRNNHQNLRSVFNSAVIIHVSLALIILILAETVGLWFLYHKINIPDGRFDAAFWVYQFSILSVMMTIIQTPYDAAIIAHQKMGVYAYVSILDALLKLLIAYLVYLSPYDKLIAYAGLVLVVSMIIRLIYQIYCRRNFAECQFKWVINKDYIKSISSFFGWDLFGNFSIVVKNQGLQLVINFFFGVFFNTVSGIATTISGIVQGLASNFSVAVKPQIVLYYAQNNFQEMFKLTKLSARLTFYLMFLLSIPFVCEGNFILNLWLKSVPPYTYVFCLLILAQIVFSRLHTALNDVISASGKIERWSFFAGCINILNVLLTYFLLLFYKNPILSYVAGIICLIPSLLINLYYTKIIFKNFDIFDYIIKVYFKCISVAFISMIVVFSVKIILPDTIIFSITNIIFSIFISLVLIWFVGMNKTEKNIILEKIRK
ncbi:hypothetical protein [Daejeonia sp. YH14]|uniref:hypothetical protein n=1 Tax=Daejeonia sp. YH14 TaxID=3439042 RepID=UPI003F493D18